MSGGSKSLLNKSNLVIAAHYPALQQLRPTPKRSTERSKQLFRILTTSGSVKQKLVDSFFMDLDVRLASAKDIIPYHQLNYDSWKSMAEDLSRKFLSIDPEGRTESEFLRGMRGRMWWFMGTYLFEPFIKYGPPRGYLNDAAAEATGAINSRISIRPTDPQLGKKWSPYRMISLSGKRIDITEKFDAPLAGLEFILETSDGEKAFLDFGHIVFNKSGHWTTPTPTEIKLPRAAGKVPRQFSEFVPRLKRGTNLIVKFAKSDLVKVKKLVGSGILTINQVGDLIHAEMDLPKLVFDPITKNQIVVKPGPNAWGLVGPATLNPVEINIDIGATTKGGGFNFWKFSVEVNRSPFERLYQVVFLGIR